MGFIIIFDPVTGEPMEIMGDVEQAKRALGLPHMRGKKLMTEQELDEIDKGSE